MAYTTIDDPTQLFNTILWTGSGNSSARSFTGVGFQPDWVWYKCRSDTYNHNFVDVVRGTGLNSEICSNKTSAEGGGDSSTHGYLSSFDADGFSSSNGSSNNLEFNQNTDTFVAWNWKAGGSASSNSDGTITSNVSVNTTAGISIVSYTGNGTTNATVGHGLGVTPEQIWFKRRDSSSNWINYDKTVGTGHYLTLNLNGAKDSASGAWCTPGSSTFQLNQVFTATNANSATYIAYCFASVQGYSKIGKYNGASSTDGTFIYTGFKPAFFMARATGRSENWYVFDTKRDGYNVDNDQLYPDVTNTEATTDYLDILSNGVKYRYNSIGLNGTGEEYIYMAFAENPFVNSKGVPGNAR